MALIEEVFDTRKDPNQIQVTKRQRQKLLNIHPATLTASENENGPLCWILLIPTTMDIMHQFLKGEISEKELLDRTPIGVSYNAIYLCSVTTLPEARNQGKTKQLCLKAIQEITKNHQIEALFVWPFSEAGEALATSIANASYMPVLFKK